MTVVKSAEIVYAWIGVNVQKKTSPSNSRKKQESLNHHIHSICGGPENGIGHTMKVCRSEIFVDNYFIFPIQPNTISAIS